MPELNVVNRSAYFDYQRQEIFVRASTSLKRVLTKALPRRSRLKPNKVLQLEAKKCDGTWIHAAGSLAGADGWNITNVAAFPIFVDIGSFPVFNMNCE